MHVVEEKPDLVFVVGDTSNAKNYILHARKMVLYLVAKQRTDAAKKLVQQAEHFDKKYRSGESITGGRKRRGTYEVNFKLMRYDDNDDETREPLLNILEDTSRAGNDFSHTTGTQNSNKKLTCSFQLNILYSWAL